MKKNISTILFITICISQIFCQEFLVFPKKEKEIGPQEVELTPTGIKFSYYDPEAKKVTIAGSFNNWDKDKMSLSNIGDGLWVRIVPLKEGDYEYKYIIDGEWMSGDNLKLSIKKDESSQQLYIAKSELRPVGRYSQKIFFYGCFDVSSYYNSVSTQQVNFNNLLNLDFKLDISANMNGNVRMRTLYDNNFGFKTNLYSAEYNIKFAKNNKITMFYNKNLFRFNNPNLYFNNVLPLVFDNIEFVYNPDENKKFGVNHYGVIGNFTFAKTFMQTGVLFNTTSYANIYFLRYDTEKLLYPLRVGLNTIVSRNERWIYSYYTSNEWFPDPERPFDSSVQPWYKGFVEKNLYSIDTAFNLFQNTMLFGEYTMSDTQLVAVRWNERIGANTPINKIWKLKENNSVLCGINQVVEINNKKLVAELGSQVSQNRFLSLLSESENSKNKNYLKLSFNSEKFQIGGNVYSTKYSYKDFVGKIKNHLIYYYEPEILYSQEYILTPVSVSTETTVSQQIFCFPEEILGGKLFVNFNTEKFYLSIKLRYESYKNNLLSNSDISITEVVSENYFKIYKQLYLFFIPRMFSYNDNLYYTQFVGTVFVLPKCGFIKLGFGVDPHTSNEDISTFVDLQRQKLYEYFGETKSIKDAEEKFINFSNSNIMLRFLVRF